MVIKRVRCIITHARCVGQHHIYVKIDEFWTLMDVDLNVGVFSNEWFHVVAELDDW